MSTELKNNKLGKSKKLTDTVESLDYYVFIYDTNTSCYWGKFRLLLCYLIYKQTKILIYYFKTTGKIHIKSRCNEIINE